MGKPLLLIVDDEPDLGEFVQDVAESSGFEVKLASSAKQLMDFWSSEGASAIAMDIVMPDMDGIELIGWLAKQECAAPIIVMSGYEGRYSGSASALGRAGGINIIGTLAKPFGAEELEMLLDLALRRRHLNG